MKTPDRAQSLSHQAPIGSGFGASSRAEDVIQGINLTGRHVIVTGGYSGIGLETVRVLVKAGAKVTVPARDRERAAQALRGIEVELADMDLIDPASVAAFAKQYIATGKPLGILINNAGIMAGPLKRDSRGYESQFATNHLGHFQLVAGLLPALRRAGEAGGARVISVSSAGHRYSPVMLEDPNFERRAYDPWLAYGQSKSANILFAVELDRRESAAGIRAFSLHPGVIVETNLGKHISKDDLRKAGMIDADGKPVLDPERQFKTVEQGAATSVWAATSPKLDGMGGVYCENCDVGRVMTDEDAKAMAQTPGLRRLGVRSYAIAPVGAEKLWALSEKFL